MEERQDLISRQDAINVAKQHWYKPDIAKALEELPSAQPTQTDTSNTLKALDCVERQAAIDAVNNERCEHGMIKDILCDKILISAKDRIRRLPPAQPEQKIGKFIRWMEKREEPKDISYTPHCKCSLCGNELIIENIKYCYICGARLIEDRESERREE